MRRYLGSIFTVLCVVLTALGAYNVLSENKEVEALAQKSAPACASGCTMTRLDRTPFAQQFTFTNRQGQTANIHCSRAALLLGEYTCQPQ